MIPEKSYKWSKFTYVLEQNNVTALYNSLKLMPIFVDSGIVSTLQSFGNGKTLSQVTDTLDSEKTAQLTSLMPHLEKAKILVNTDITDREILNWFQSNYTGHPYVSIAYFILTDNCNFGCKYCFIENRISQGYRFSHMTRETAQKGIDMFCRLISLVPELFSEKKTIILYGGEPLLNFNTIQYILETVQDRIQDGRLPEQTVINLVTNGSLVTPEIAKILKTYNVSVGVSLDGDRNVTDSCRQYQNGKPVYDDVIKGFETLKQEGVDTGISCTLTPQCIDNFDDTLDLIVNKLDLKTMAFNIALSVPGYQTGEDYYEKATQSIIKAFQIFRDKGIYEDRMMLK